MTDDPNLRCTRCKRKLKNPQWLNGYVFGIVCIKKIKLFNTVVTEQND